MHFFLIAGGTLGVSIESVLVFLNGGKKFYAHVRDLARDYSMRTRQTLAGNTLDSPDKLFREKNSFKK